MLHNSLRAVARRCSVVERAVLRRSQAALAVSCVLALTSLPAAADEAPFEYPQTRAGEIARAFFESFNSADAERLAAFIQTYRSDISQAARPLEDRVQQAIGMHGQVGDLVPAVVQDEGDDFLEIVAQATGAGMYVLCRFEMEAEQPDRLGSMSMRPTAPPDALSGEAEEWTTLAELLAQIHESAGVPAIAAAMIEDGRIVDVAVVGVRMVGSDDKVVESDCFHVGSITKSMTATMIARLVEAGKMDWDDTIGGWLGDIDMNDAYRNVTLDQVLRHRSGLDSYADFDDDEMGRLVGLAGTPTAQRSAFVAEVLSKEPIATPGTAMNYSNAGYAVAGLMAERATGRAWEDLMRDEVFTPMHLETAVIGWPATEAHSHQPRGHVKEDGTYRPLALDEYSLGAFLAPAGDVSMSVRDLATYAQAHLAGMRGRDGVVAAATMQHLHEPVIDGSDKGGYACGWVVQDPDEGVIHWHNGSAGTFFALTEIYPESNRAIIVTVNVGLEGAGIAELISKRINERWQGK